MHEQALLCVGSERLGKSEATGDRLEEAKHINKSLSALGEAVLPSTQPHVCIMLHASM